MEWYWSPAGVVMAATVPVLGVLAASAWRRRPAAAAGDLALVLVAASWWSLAYALELSGASLATVRFWGDLKYLGIMLLAPAWLVFALRYTDRGEWITRGRIVAMGIVPALTVAVLANRATHDLIRYYPEFEPGTVPYAAMGPLFWVHTAYTYVLLLSGVTLLVTTCLRAPRPYRRQGVVVAVAATLCLIGNVSHITGVGLLRYFDITPFAILTAGLVLVQGVLRYGLLELVPVARDTVVERMSDAVVVLDRYRRVVDLNTAARTLLETSPDGGVGEPVAGLLPGAEAVLDHAEADVDGRGELHLAARGEHLELVLSGLHDARGRRSGQVLVLRDVTARKRDEERLSRLALEDTLTGIANRNALSLAISAALDGARDGGPSFGLLFCDVDRFKRINDTLGHEVGDRALQAVAARLTRVVPRGDLVARLGGDEFVVLVAESSSAALTDRMARVVVDAFRTPLLVGPHALYLTLSVGACQHPDGGTEVAALLRHADAAMYRAKAAGRNRAMGYHGEPDVVSSQGLQLERDLHDQSPRELELHYQPVIDLATRTCVGVEALLRWRHPVRGLLEPDAFVGIAEQSGLMPKLGTWVLHEACTQARQWQRARGAPLGLAVNVSAQQVDPLLVRDVALVLDHTGLDPACLTLEITESAVLHDEHGALDVLADLKALGVRIATDDFGTGYTSLEQLRRYPLDVLKIDRSFVRGLGGNSADDIIVAALISLAHDLGLEVVAEGVETAAQRDRLASYGCDQVQGFLFSPPLAVEAASAYLRLAASPPPGAARPRAQRAR